MNNYPPQQPPPPAVDVLPSHLPPPKQIGNVSHRRVVSTGDVSHISNLTDGDSVVDVLEESPPAAMETAAAVGAPTAVMAAGTAASTTDVPSHPSMFGVDTGRQRGVSWDFGTGGRVYEEPATFEGLGIMQPVLSEEDLGKLAMDDEDLIQPVLMEEELQTNKPPIAPAELKKAVSDGKVGLGKVSIGKSGWDKLRQNRKAVTQLGGGNVKLSPGAFSKKDGGQFEDEAERAILAALGLSSDALSPAPSAEKVVGSDSPRTPRTPEETGSVEVPPVVSSTKTSQHRKNVSSMTNVEVADSPVLPNIHNLNQKPNRAELFEDQGWHDGYDNLGRNKGSLREDQDAKIVEDVLGGELQIPELAVGGNVEHSPMQSDRKASTPPGSAKPSLVSRAKTDGAVTKKSDALKKKDDDYQDPNKESHVRSKTIVSDFAQEMAKYQTTDGVYNRNKTHMSKDSHGVDNLLNGADLLFKVGEKKVAKPAKAEPIEDIHENDDDEYQENSEGDEEMGEAHPKRKRARFISATRRSSNKNDSRSERSYQMKRWYIDLLKPKVSSRKIDMLI